MTLLQVALFGLAPGASLYDMALQGLVPVQVPGVELFDSLSVRPVAGRLGTWLPNGPELSAQVELLCHELIALHQPWVEVSVQPVDLLRCEQQQPSLGAEALEGAAVYVDLLEDCYKLQPLPRQTTASMYAGQLDAREAPADEYSAELQPAETLRADPATSELQLEPLESACDVLPVEAMLSAVCVPSEFTAEVQGES